jgi:hypothetical protein
MRNPTTPCLLVLFAISSGAVYAQENQAGANASQWPVYITHDPDYVRTDHPSMLNNAVLDLACKKDHGPTLGASLYGYKGNGLERNPNIDRPAYFVIMTAEGQEHRFPMMIHYDAPGEAWALGSDLPPDFLQMFVPGSALVLENAEFDQILVFDLVGSESFRSAAAGACAIAVSATPDSTPPRSDVTAALRSASQADGSASLCSPKIHAARILSKPAPNAVHPHWRGDNFVGPGWTFVAKQTVTNTTGIYARGDLHGSRGGVVNRDIFILLSEWECRNG